MNTIIALLRGSIAFLAVFLNTFFWSIPFFAVALVKLLIPTAGAHRALTAVLVELAERWIGVNNRLFILAPGIRWEVNLPDDLRLDATYLIAANHLSSIDVPVIQRVFHRRIPFIRFFIKQELIWVPLLGQAWWALDFPFLKRYSADYLARNPHKRGVDQATAVRVAARAAETPTTFLIFAEGTRYTAAKHAAQIAQGGNPYANLLNPRAGGLVRVMETLGDGLAALLDVTLIYPDGPVRMWHLLSGKVTRVIVDVRALPLPAFVGTTDLNSEAGRAEMRAWLDGLWHAKDALIRARMVNGARS